MLTTKKIKLISCFLLIFISVIFWQTLPVTAKINQVETINNKWEIITGNKVSLSLPSGYIGGNPAQDLDDLTTKLEQINPSLAHRLQPIKQQDLNSINLLAFNTNIDKINLIDNVNIVSQENQDKLSLAQYISQQNKNQIFANIKLSEKITLKDNLMAEKIIADYTQENIIVKQLYYILEKSGKFWTVTYTTNADQFEQNLPIFEQSITTLKI